MKFIIFGAIFLFAILCLEGLNNRGRYEKNPNDDSDSDSSNM